MEYRVIIASENSYGKSVRVLEQKVKELLDLGWKLQGGVVVSRSDYEYFIRIVIA